MNTIKDSPHILVNGLCVPAGGGFTVTSELLLQLASLKPEWRFTLALSKGRGVHREFESVRFPDNVSLLWTPAITANRFFRVLYENSALPAWARTNDVAAVLQVNGMIVPALKLPTLSHFGDPAPHRRDLREPALLQRIHSALRRREQLRALRRASFVGWTSAYLRDLVCSSLGFVPARSEVFHNGLSERQLASARGPLPAWHTREMEILTVSNVVPHKRQALVVRALARLRTMKGLENARYRIVGECEDAYCHEIERLAIELGVADAVIFEGRVSPSRVEECFLRARAFAFMSVCECFGLPPVEAMAFGTPCVVADCCSAREIYGDAVDYCIPDDIDALVGSLRRVMLDEPHAEELRRLGAVQAQRFSWLKTAQRMAGRFEQIIERPFAA